MLVYSTRNAPLLLAIRRELRMATDQIGLSQYERRMKTVTDIVLAHSKLTNTVAKELAIAVLHALDTIPERIR